MRFTLFCKSARRLPANMEAMAIIENTRSTGREAVGSRLVEIAQQQREHAAFRNGGDKGRHRRGRPLDKHPASTCGKAPGRA